MNNINNKQEIPEANNLRWLANMFPFIKDAKDETDKMSNAINVYCTAGADKIEELSNKDVGKYKVVTLCGITKFKSKFEEIKRELTLKGYIVLTLGIFGKSDLIHETDLKELILEEMHKQIIDMSDEIYVINVGGCIGESTKAKIEYAKSKGKKVNYLEDSND